MAAERYVHVTYPWRATIEAGSAQPARFYLALIAQTLQCGAPASRPGGRVWAKVVRQGIPERPLAGLLRRGGRVLRGGQPPIVSAELVAERWAELREADPTLPPAEDLSVLELARASAVTTFVFGRSPVPLVVVKNARGSGAGVATEVAALQEAAGTGLAPSYLGSFPGLGEVQRGLPGHALAVRALTPHRSRELAWLPEHQAFADGILALSRATRKAVVPEPARNGVVQQALTHPGLSPRTRMAVAEAEAELERLEVSVLGHVDTSPQNILYENGRLSGLVDWADANTHGVPGADVLNAAMAYIELGVGLVRWDDRSLLGAFEGGYLASEYGRRARSAARACAEAAGVPPDLAHGLELTFFARRLGWRMRAPESFPTSAELALRALERVRAEGDPS